MARPREFDAEEALDKAMGLFWAKGYHDSSIRDLVDRTGVNFYGLYGVFENKHGLFLAALDRYRDTVTAGLIRELEKADPALDRIERALTGLLQATRTLDGYVGCMMCNTAIEMAPHDPVVAAKVDAHTQGLEAAFRATLAEGQAAGDVAPDRDIDALAEFLTTTIYSIGLLLRSGAGEARARRHIRTALAAVA